MFKSSQFDISQLLDNDNIDYFADYVMEVVLNEFKNDTVFYSISIRNDFYYSFENIMMKMFSSPSIGYHNASWFEKTLRKSFSFKGIELGSINKSTKTTPSEGISSNVSSNSTICDRLLQLLAVYPTRDHENNLFLILLRFPFPMELQMSLEFFPESSRTINPVTFEYLPLFQNHLLKRNQDNVHQTINVTFFEYFIITFLTYLINTKQCLNEVKSSHFFGLSPFKSTSLLNKKKEDTKTNATITNDNNNIDLDSSPINKKSKSITYPEKIGKGNLAIQLFFQYIHYLITLDRNCKNQTQFSKSSSSSSSYNNNNNMNIGMNSTITSYPYGSLTTSTMNRNDINKYNNNNTIYSASAPSNYFNINSNYSTSFSSISSSSTSTITCKECQFFFDAITALWMPPLPSLGRFWKDIYSNVGYPYFKTYKVPSINIFQCIRYMVLYIQQDPDIKNNGSSQYLTTIQKPLFYFLARNLAFAPIEQDTFYRTVEIWLCYMQPWANNDLYNNKSPSIKYSDEYKIYVCNNYLFYSSLLLIFLKRSVYFDYTNENIRNLFMDVLSVYTEQLCSLFDSIELFLEQRSQIGYNNFDPITTTLFETQMKYVYDNYRILSEPLEYVNFFILESQMSNLITMNQQYLKKDLDTIITQIAIILRINIEDYKQFFETQNQQKKASKIHITPPSNDTMMSRSYQSPLEIMLSPWEIPSLTRFLIKLNEEEDDDDDDDDEDDDNNNHKHYIPMFVNLRYFDTITSLLYNK
ncbi:hypothetical protein WA158_003133 [Blastocystis sp. Blastoise]